MSLPLVSVIIPTYERPRYLKRAIDSVLSQTYDNIEIIVVDDNDSHSPFRKQTIEVMRDYHKNDQIRYIKHKNNKNGAAARNTGINNARGDYIAFLDDDDEFLKTKIELQVSKLEHLDSSWGICYTGFERRLNGKLIDRSKETSEGFLVDSILKGELYLSAGSNLLIRTDIAREIRGFDEKFERRQDLEFLIRANKKSKIACVDDIALVIHKDDRTNTLNYSGLEKNTNIFLSSFDSEIKKLDLENQKKVFLSQHLLLVRYHLIRKNFKSVYKLSKKHDISLWLLFRYILYLSKRKILKQCYGFKI